MRRMKKNTGEEDNANVKGLKKKKKESKQFKAVNKTENQQARWCRCHSKQPRHHRKLTQSH